MKTERQIVQEAEEHGHEFCVLPPEEGFPYPKIGYRLMKFDQNILFGWVCIQFGHQEVLHELARLANEATKPASPLTYPLLKESDS